mmetsp:Transcript_73686/g.216222  ORF Transcript_73686/g.216222 Transcript_73686/m.216222 type:complete len:201 (-) Transcript_73686:2324-2926(-)
MAEVNVRCTEGIQGLRSPCKRREHGSYVTTHTEGPSQGARAMLFKRPRALLKHLRVFAMCAHGGKHCSHAATAAAVLQCVFLPRKCKERPAPDALQLYVGPVLCHNIHDRAHASVLVSEEAGPEPRYDEDPTGEDVWPVPVLLHDVAEYPEDLWGHAVVLEELPERDQRCTALQLDLRVTLEEAHGLQEAVDALEGPQLV